jgi:hypothetical protein
MYSFNTEPLSEMLQYQQIFKLYECGSPCLIPLLDDDDGNDDDNNNNNNNNNNNRSNWDNF